jgi:membrane-associated phospholipid phosphatase
MRILFVPVMRYFHHKLRSECFKNLILLLIFFLLSINTGFGQEINSSTMGQRFTSDVGDAFDGSVHVFSRPLHWQGDDWLNFGYVIAGAAVISLVDTEVRDFFLRNQSKTGDDILKIGEFYGEPLSVVLITGGIYLFGNIADNDWARETAVIMTAALLPGGIYQTIAKISAGRSRPYLDLGNYYFDPFRMEEDYYSFVSGHMLVATTTSLVLAERINNTIAKGFLYSLGILAGVSRLYSDNNWLSDIVLGGALAAAVTHSATSWHNTTKKNYQSALDIRVLPSRNGITLTLKW